MYRKATDYRHKNTARVHRRIARGHEKIAGEYGKKAKVTRRQPEVLAKEQGVTKNRKPHKDRHRKEWVLGKSHCHTMIGGVNRKTASGLRRTEMCHSQTGGGYGKGLGCI